MRKQITTRFAGLMSGTRGQSAATVAAGLGGQLLLVASGVFVTRILGPDNRGFLALIVIFPTILGTLGLLGMPVALTYYIAREPNQTRHLVRRLIRPGVIHISFLLIMQGLVIAVVFQSRPGYVAEAAWLSLLALPAWAGQAVGLAILQGEHRFRAFNILRLLPLAFYGAAACALYLLHAGTLMIVVISLVAAYGIASILTLTLALRGTKASPVSDMSQPTVRESYGFALRSVLGSVFPVDAFSLDQLVVGLVLSPAALGYYVVATAFTNVPRFIGQSLGMVGYPTVAAKREPAFAMRTVWRFALASVVLGGAVVIALEVVMGWVVPFFFGSAFIHSVETARILLVASFFVSVRRVLGDCVRGAGMPSLGSIAEASSWFVAGPAIVLLVPRGINGVAVAMAISYGFSLGILIAGIALHRWRTGPSSQVIVGTAANDRGIGP